MQYKFKILVINSYITITMLYKEGVEMVHDVSGQNGVQERVNFRPFGTVLALCLGRTWSIAV
jgi:hypothetical protein